MSKEKRQVMIAPSILSADFSRLAEEIADVERSGCDSIHVDVMDGHFVPNLTIGAPVVRSLRKITKLPLDVHLMIDEPLRFVEDFKKAGSDWLTFHIEATEKIGETIGAIRSAGMKVGISLRPKTPVESLFPWLDQLDLVLVMTVEPGFGGQSFMADMMPKIRSLKQKFKGLVSVDGGINAETAPVVLEAGADVLVAGSYIFRHGNRAEAIQSIRPPVD